MTVEVNRARHRKACRPATAFDLINISGADIKRGLVVAASSGLAFAALPGAAASPEAASQGTVQVDVAKVDGATAEALNTSSVVVTSQDVEWSADSVQVQAAAPIVVEAQDTTPAPAARVTATQPVADVPAPVVADPAPVVAQPEQPAAQPAANPEAVAPAAGSYGATVDIAMRYIGTPYVYGGTSPAGFDCSGLVQYVYRQAGVNLPRTSWAQGAAGQRVSAAQARPGDIVYWGHHVGIYAGGGRVIDAPYPGAAVTIRGIWGAPSYVRIG